MNVITVIVGSCIGLLFKKGIPEKAGKAAMIGIDTKEFNQLPTESGTYHFINVLYSAEDNTMKLVEYQIEYTQS